MLRNRVDVPRRSFLARLGLGAGATLLTPFVHTMQAEAQGVVRKRFLLVLQGNGLYWDRFIPTELRTRNGAPASDVYGPNPGGWGSVSPADMTPQNLVNRTDWSRLPPTLKALEPKYAKKMLIVDGLANRQNGLTGNHGNGASSVTCVPQPNGNGESGGAGGISFDQYLAASPAMGNGVFRSVDLAAFFDSTSFSHMAYGPGRTVPLVGTPKEALARYFAGVTSMDDGTAKLLLAKKQRLFDLMRTDIKRLQGALGTAERDKLDQYLDSIAKIEQRITSAPAATACRAGGPPLPAGTAIEDKVDAMMAIAAEALACGLTQVASVSITTGLDHWGTWSKAAGDVWDGAGPHYLAHGEGTYGLIAWDRVYNYVAAAIARAADRLQSAYESGSSVFANSAIVWHSTNGASHHNPYQYRWNGVVVGDAGGKLKADGRYLRYPTTYYLKPTDNPYQGIPNRSTSPDNHSWGDFYCTIAHALGAPTDAFGKAGVEPVKGPLREALA